MPPEPTVNAPIAPGAHILVRDAVWRVLQVNRTSSGKNAWHVVGVSEIVRDQDAIFLEDYEPNVTVLDPSDTALELDSSPGHRDGLLYMESLLRDVPPTGPELHIGHKAALDVMDFQLDPARMALQKPRQRILIADTVGLGKTLEAGILMSELIRRGKGKRILVATVKSMLTQFQKELWCRFSIPLVRLDSTGLHRIQEQIPTNHNPFYQFDRTIISIDTLKQNNAFRTHVEKAWWDIIVIDEAHNVAARGGGRSQRNRIAEILADRSDALILLSATPHDGKARSFASLMNMLDPTAIANPDSYTRDEIDGLFVRRFKQDVAHQMGKAFPERRIAEAHATASPAEEDAFDCLAELKLTVLDAARGAHMLVKTGLAKALFSSPIACSRQLTAALKRDRVRPLLPADFFPRRRDDETRSPSQVLHAAAAHLDGDLRDDILALADLAGRLEDIGPDDFSKYRKLLSVIGDPTHGFGWTARKKDDRLVIFSERIETLKWLHAQLSSDLGLKPDQVALLHGGLSDTDQQAIVEDFGNSSAKVRLLLASDVASEGLNLHYLCHRLIHFDVPWSLMVFQQRNGRIDRYGQERTPEIVYLLTDSQNDAIKGDQRILELLIQRDEEAVKNIAKKGDPSALMGVYNIDEQERFTARMMEEGLTPEQADQRLGGGLTIDPLELLLGLGPSPVTLPPAPRSPLTLFPSDLAYLRTSLDRLADLEGVHHEVREADRIVEIQLPPDTEESRRRRAPGLDLRRRFRKLPAEVLPDDGVVVLTPDTTKMQEAVREARREETAWPRLQYLWPLHPVVQWAQDKGRAAFPRHTAPVLTLLHGLPEDEAIIVISGLIPNRRSQPLVHRWFAARFRNGAFQSLEDFGDVSRQLQLGTRPLPNRKVPADLDVLRALVPVAVDHARAAMADRCRAFDDAMNPQLQAELDRLEGLKSRQLAQLQLDFAGKPAQQALRDQKHRRIGATFDRYLEWVQDSMTTEPVPFLQVIAALRPEQGFGGAQ